MARVYSNVAVMDRQVGELLAELDEAGLADDTIVVFYSDNGGPLPRGKREVLDSGLHVPFLLRFPDGAHAGTVVDDLVAFVDIPATILSLAGVPVPRHMQGHPFWGEQKAPSRDFVFAARDRMDERTDAVRAVRDRRFEYIRNYRPELPRYQDIAFRREMAAMRDLLRLRDRAEPRPRPVPLVPADEAGRRALRHRDRSRTRCETSPATPAYRPASRATAGGPRRLAARDQRPARARPRRELIESMWPGGVQPKTAAPAIAWRDGRGSRSNARPRARPSPTRWTAGACAPATGSCTQEPFEAPSGSVVTAAANRVGYAPSPEVRFVVP